MNLLVENLIGMELGTIENYWELLGTIGNYWELLGTIGNYWELGRVVISAK